MNSKGFRDEDGNFITIPGESVKYDAMSGHLARFDENGNIIDGGEAPDFIESSQAQVLCDNEGIHLNISDNGVTITYSNLVNLFRALQTPDNTPTENSDKLVTSGGVKTALDGKAPANYVPLKIERTTPEGTSRVLVDGEEIEFFIEDVTGDDPREATAALNFSKMPNFARALRDPDNTPTEDSDNLIKSGAVYDALAEKANNSDLDGKLEKVVNEGIVFDVSNNALALKSDTTIYDSLFREGNYTFPVEIAVYDSVEDENVPFVGFCKTNFDGTTLSSRVFIGERVIVLHKVKATGVVTLSSTYTLGSLLS